MSKYLLFALLIALTASGGSALAHEGSHDNMLSQVVTSASPESADDVISTTTVELAASPAASPVVAPSSPMNIFLIARYKFQRFFVRNPLKRSELTAKIVTALYEKAKEQQAAGNTEAATTTLAKYERESDYLDTVIDTVNASTTDPQVHTLLDQIVTDRAAVLVELQQEDSLASQLLAKKATHLEAKTLQRIVKLLERDMPEAKREERLAKLQTYYGKHAGKLTRPADSSVHELELIDALNAATSSATLSAALEKREDKVVEEVAQLDSEAVESIASQLRSQGEDELRQIRRSLIVLEKLLAKVPDPAKPAIEAAIDTIAGNAARKLETDSASISTFVDDKSGSSEVHDQVMDRVKEKVKPEVSQKLEAAAAKHKSKESKKKPTEGSPTPASTLTPAPDEMKDSEE